MFEETLQILVTTTVIEVGVDVKNANIMVIYDAHRFGLSQIHQLRGRVGRGDKAGYCYLLSDTKDMESKKRLQACEKTNDGFELARIDLELRGPGDILGTRQSGVPGFILGDVIQDANILEVAREDACAILKNIECEEYAPIRAYIQELKTADKAGLAERSFFMDTIFEWLKQRGIQIENKERMVEALTHSSYVNEHKASKHDNERLEFMGDAVLQLWSTRKLFHLTPALSEGQMTTLRAQLVCEEALAAYNRTLGWGKYLLLGVGEEKTGGRNRDSLLADMFEAVLGAIYLDQGMEAVDIILESVLTPAITQPKSESVIDYKTKLQEYIQADTRKNVHYELVSTSGPSNAPFLR